MPYAKPKNVPFSVNSDGTRVLQVHSRGDKRFSPMVAKVKVNGKLDTIENHYQSAKVFEGGQRPKDWREAREMKHLRQTGWNITGIELPTRQDGPRRFAVDDFGVQFYCLLWAKYILAHPELVEYASEFDAFEDPFEGSFPFGQAKVWALVSLGDSGVRDLLKMSEELVGVIRAARPK